ELLLALRNSAVGKKITSLLQTIQRVWSLLTTCLTTRRRRRLQSLQLDCMLEVGLKDAAALGHSILYCGHGTFEEFIAAFGNAGARARDGDRGNDAHTMMSRPVVLQYLHSSPCDRVTAREGERIHIAVRSSGRRADDGAELVRLDNTHARFG